MNARVGTDRGYLLFPLRNNPRAVFDLPSLPKFELHLLWRGDPSVYEDLEALVTVFGHLGALGFRSRRAMGALSLSQCSIPLKDALDRFSGSSRLVIRALPAKDCGDAIIVLARWLKSWRAHGRSGNNASEQSLPGFQFAKADHDAGVAAKSHRPSAGATHRPSLGLPIVQFFSSDHKEVKWEYGRGTRDEPKGRFASPVLLRPHLDAQGKWHALVIFVEAHKWPTDPDTGKPRQVFLNGQPHDVSLDLYEAMKRDPRLTNFP